MADSVEWKCHNHIDVASNCKFIQQRRCIIPDIRGAVVLRQFGAVVVVGCVPTIPNLEWFKFRKMSSNFLDNFFNMKSKFPFCSIFVYSQTL